ncbi:MAG: molecular chaperone DnaJ [Candidatus Hydrogenedentes bacterium]|nr:molecular chaperone DnaJ [Candidatus Hydrogenedentota bacterium]
MPKQIDLYEILGVSRDASDDEIRRAYLKLAHKYHPDKTGGDKEAENKLKEINAAYDILKNPEKRKQYDRFGSMSEQAGFGGGYGGAGFGGAGFESPFDDFFDMLFGRGGGGRGRSAARPGNDLEYRTTITLEEAAFGAKRKLKFARMELCNECSGTGAAPGSRPETCPVCHGAGQVRVAQGFFSVTQTCHRCRGAGKIVSKPCPRCSGTGRVRLSREINVDIPAGIDSGMRLRVAGEGEPGENGGPRGDLHVLVEVEAHEIFAREGVDIICEFPVSFTQAAVGDTVRVPTLRGDADLKIPPGTQSGTLFRLRGLGMPDLRGYRQGDQIVKVVVEIPAKLTRRQRELLKEFEQENDAKTYPLYRRFMDKLKKYGEKE